VLLAIAVNLLSAYLKGPIDNYFAKRSKRKRASLLRRNQLFDQRVNSLVANPHLLVLEAFDAQRERNRFLFYLILMLSAFALSFLVRHGTLREPFALFTTAFSVGIMVFGLLAAILGTWALMDAQGKERLIDAARTRLSPESDEA